MIQQYVRRVLCLLAVGTAACRAPTIRSIRHDRWDPPPEAAPDAKERAAERNRIRSDGPSTPFRIEGRGTCGRIRVHFGDGDSTDIAPADFSSGSIRVAHAYRGWGGPKTVTAETIERCVGRATTTVTVEPAAAFVGMPATGIPCTPVNGSRPLRRGTVVTVRDTNDPNAVITFSLVTRARIDGVPAVALGSPFNFPFPGLRAHSLVLRVGTQVVQGGNGVTFTTNQAGVLEACFNDDLLHDNKGFWNFFLSIDERNAR